MPFEDFKERRAMEARATLARRPGRVTENRSPVRPHDDIELNHRGNGVFYDQTGQALWGLLVWGGIWA